MDTKIMQKEQMKELTYKENVLIMKYFYQIDTIALMLNNAIQIHGI